MCQNLIPFGRNLNLFAFLGVIEHLYQQVKLVKKEDANTLNILELFCLF